MERSLNAEAGGTEVRDQRSEVRRTEAMQINSAKDLKVYKAAYELSMRIFELTKSFPAEERFALTSQIRRSSRSVCLNLREAWAKRRYEAHFINKLTDCDGENSETDSSLDFTVDCKYITSAQHAELVTCCQEIGRMLGSMIKNPRSFLISDH
jgi:four helix bundle protein